MPEIKMRKLGELRRHPDNPRHISKARFNALMDSIKENHKYFEGSPVKLSDRTGKLVIIGGNMRYEAAKAMGLKELPTILISGLTVEEERKAILLDNAHFGEWDWDLLANKWDDIDLPQFGIEIPSFDLDADLEEPEPVEEDENAVEEVINKAAELQLKWNTSTGQLWKLGNHRVLCGDSTNASSFDVLMAGRKASISFTSPPYNAGHLNVSGNHRTKPKYREHNDNYGEDEYFDFLSSNLGLLLVHSDEVFYNIGMVQGNKKIINRLLFHFNELYKETIYWEKSRVAPHIQPGIVNNLVELILCFGDGRRKFLNAQFGQGTYFNVIKGPGASENKFSDIHKATFPVYLPENIVSNFCPKNGIVVDSFLGTGTTIIACENMNRRCYGIEISPEYVAIILERWAIHTGHTPELIER